MLFFDSKIPCLVIVSLKMQIRRKGRVFINLKHTCVLSYETILFSIYSSQMLGWLDSNNLLLSIYLSDLFIIFLSWGSRQCKQQHLSFFSITKKSLMQAGLRESDSQNHHLSFQDYVDSNLGYSCPCPASWPLHHICFPNYGMQRFLLKGPKVSLPSWVFQMCQTSVSKRKKKKKRKG